MSRLKETGRRMAETVIEEARSITVQPEYEALGIHPDTMTCVAILSKVDAKRYAWALSLEGIEHRVTLDPDKKRWHIAVVGGLAYNPAAWVASLRPENAVTCTAGATGQHPLKLEENE